MGHPVPALFLTSLLVLLRLVAAVRAQQHRDCPPRCQCEEDGMRLRVDCSDLGLTTLPANLSVFTSYLKLNQNLQTPAHPSHLTFLNLLFFFLFLFFYRMLQNNQLRQVPSEALRNLRNLQSLRLDANHIHSVPPNCFDGLVSLRHLWLDDNSLTEVPLQALSSLSSLQAMTLALNKITHIPDRAFANLSSLVVLHLHNNRIHSLGKKCFDGLHSLETLDLNYNSLDEFPVGIKALGNLKELFHSNNIKSIPEHAFIGNPSLVTIFFYDNPIQFVGKSAFQHLPELRTLHDNAPTCLLELLSLVFSLLTFRDLSYNLIQELPSFNGCDKLQKIDLAWNKLSAIEPNAFSHLPSLIKLDLSANLLSTFPVAGLHGLTHLKLAGNEGLQELLSKENFPKLRVMEMPYAFQCCAFVSCEIPNKLSNPWDRDENSSSEDFNKKETNLLPGPDYPELDDFLLDFEEDLKVHHSVQCSPAPGPFRPCDHLFGSWLIRTGVWTIVVLSLLCNSLVAITIFTSPTYISPSKFLLGLLAIVNGLMGLSSGILAVVDALTFGSFAKYGAWWESGIGCKITGFLSVFSSEACIFLLTTSALERGLSIKCSKSSETKYSKTNVKLVSAFCFFLALAITILPLLHVGEYGISALCLPLPFGEPSSLGFLVALVLLNSLCYFVMTVTYTRLYCNLEKGELDNFWDCSMIKHVAWLLFANCILYFPVAFLSFSSLLSLSFISPEVIKSILLVIVPLPACLNPTLYILFNPHFKEDLGLLLKQAGLSRKCKQASMTSLNSEDAEKQSCDSTQALVTFVNADKLSNTSGSKAALSTYQIIESCHSQAVAFIPCR
uniref:Leucine rich repeat containing G protein-coupled receptor 5 n=1 Tax=Erpetoichthys calabaricus TaxID=27687 RepID=A0A8C4RPC8_ERPCA